MLKYMYYPEMEKIVNPAILRMWMTDPINENRVLITVDRVALSTGTDKKVMVSVLYHKVIGSQKINASTIFD